MTVKPPSQRYVLSVQGLRGVSALCVFCVHIYLMALHGGFFPAAPTDLVDGISTLGNGVALFFIISGYVVPASLVRHKSVRRFLIDRLLRIMPVFLTIHVIVFAAGPLIGYKWMVGFGTVGYLKSFFANMTFTALPLGFPLAQQNSWTLTYEWLFYLFLSVSWYVTAHGTGSWKVGVCLGLVGLAICMYFQECFYFVLGMAFAFFRIQLRMGWIAEIIVIPVAVVAFFYGAQFVGLLYALPAAFLIFSLVLQDGSLTSRLLCLPVLQKLGMISYSLYLVHPLTTFPYQVVGAYLMHHGANTNVVFPVFVIAAVSTALTVSLLSYWWLEVKLRNAIATHVARQLAVVARSGTSETSG